MKIFIVDDERILRVSIADDLKDNGHNVFEFSDAIAALTHLKEDSEVDVIFTDLKMPRMDGIEFLKKVKELKPEIVVVLMTAYSSIDTAIQAMKLGAYDYITKPFQTEELMLMLDRIKELHDVKDENKTLKKSLELKYDFSSFVGSSKEVNNIFNLVRKVSNFSTTVLISGETGTGKELLTNIIYYNSTRKKQPIIKVSCAILSKEIFESELFGHEKGAFTGADRMKQGRFELANNGTLYLDDIDDIPLELQVKLLRVLEEGEIERVGGSETIKVDVRVIASTKVDLLKCIDRGTFRRDLFYRLNIFPIVIPPLRERKDDIRFLMDHFSNQFSPEIAMNIEESVYKVFLDYPFPGNVRELRNLMERLVLLSNHNKIEQAMIPCDVMESINITDLPSCASKPLNEMLADLEIKAIKLTLNKTHFNKTKAAKLLGIPLTTLCTKIDKYNL